jgi:O-antigen ligase
MALRRRLVWSIVLAVLAEAIVTVIYGRTGRGGRATGSFGQSNDLGAFLAIFTVFSASMLPAIRNGLGRLTILATIVVGSLAVLFTISRGAILALAVGLLLVAFRTSKLFFAVLVMVLLTAPIWTPDYVKDRVMSTQIEDEEFDEVSLEASSQLRVDTWRAIIDVVTDHPLDGVGFTGLGYVLPMTGSAMGVAVKDSAHNTYLRFLGEMGIFGLLLFVVLLFKCWSLGRQVEKNGSTEFDRRVGFGLTVATLVLALCCAFGDRFFPILITGNFWLLCALADNALREKPAT